MAGLREEEGDLRGQNAQRTGREGAAGKRQEEKEKEQRQKRGSEGSKKIKKWGQPREEGGGEAGGNSPVREKFYRGVGDDMQL